MTRQWGWACRSSTIGNSAPGGVAQRERRRGPVAPTLIDLEFLAGSDLRQSIHELVRAPKDLDVAAPGRGDNGRGLLHVSKQDHGDDGAAGVSRDIGMFSRRDMAASQARRYWEGFSTRPSSASRYRWPLFSD